LENHSLTKQPLDQAAVPNSSHCAPVSMDWRFHLHLFAILFAATLDRPEYELALLEMKHL